MHLDTQRGQALVLRRPSASDVLRALHLHPLSVPELAAVFGGSYRPATVRGAVLLLRAAGLAVPAGWEVLLRGRRAIVWRAAG
jgi:hypothetical protein